MSIIKDLIDWLQKLFQWWVIVMPWEKGIRIRLGKHVKLLESGIYLKFPIIDRVYVQNMAKRVMAGPVQTLTTLDGKTLTIAMTVGYCISDIQKLYMKLYHTEMTIVNMILGEVSDFVANNKSENCRPKEIESYIADELKIDDLGIGEVKVAVTGYAVVKTYRLIQDGHYISEGFNMDNQR